MDTCAFHQLKHQYRTRTVADLPGSPYPAHFAIRYKREVQCLFTIKLSDEAPGKVGGPLVAFSAVDPAQILIFPNCRRQHMRLGVKLIPGDYSQASGDASRLSRERKVCLQLMSSSTSADDMTVTARNLLQLYILGAGRPLPKEQNCRSFASTFSSYSTIFHSNFQSATVIIYLLR